MDDCGGLTGSLNEYNVFNYLMSHTLANVNDN